MISITIAVSFDYCLFMCTRFREEVSVELLPACLYVSLVRLGADGELWCNQIKAKHDLDNAVFNTLEVLAPLLCAR